EDRGTVRAERLRALDARLGDRRAEDLGEEAVAVVEEDEAQPEVLERPREPVEPEAHERALFPPGIEAAVGDEGVQREPPGARRALDGNAGAEGELVVEEAVGEHDVPLADGGAHAALAPREER